jgi:Vps16, N-terminal region
VLGLWNGGSLLLVGKDGERTTFAISEGMALSQEMDGVRLLSRYKHEMLQKVPAVTQEVFRINSIAPGSYLLEASRQFEVEIINVSCAFLNFDVVAERVSSI